MFKQIVYFFFYEWLLEVAFEIGFMKLVDLVLKNPNFNLNFKAAFNETCVIENMIYYLSKTSKHYFIIYIIWSKPPLITYETVSVLWSNK